MRNITVTALRKGLFGTISSAINFNEIINVSTKDGNAVIISEEEYNSLNETLYLLSIPGMRDSIVEGMNTPIDECARIDWENA